MGDIFKVVSRAKRDQILETVRQEEVSLGMVDPTTGRSLLYKLLTAVTNGDKVVIEKLDSGVSSTCEDVDDEDFAITVDHRCLVDEDPRSLILVKDLLNLPRKRTSSVLSHPLLTTFIDKNWLRTRWLFLFSFTLYFIFVILFSLFIGLMYERNNEHDVIRIPVELPQSCDALRPIDFSSKGRNEIQNRMLINDDSELIDVTAAAQTDLVNRAGIKKKTPAGRNTEEYKIKLEVVKEKRNKTRVSRVRRKEGLFMECSTRRKFQDIPLCVVESFLVVAILLLVVVETWQALALGRDYFLELENWFELLILSLTVCTLYLKAELDSLAIVASVGICLAWIELIFQFGRYPSLGGTFSIMYYSITKRIIRTALGLCLLVLAFALAFFIIHFDNTNESFESLSKSIIKSFVMVLGEFEFDDLWSNSESASSKLSQMFTMLLLVGVIMLGTIIMINLIVAIIITDIERLNKISKQQVLRNKAHHAVQIDAVRSLLRCLHRPVSPSFSRSQQMALCVHSVCRCGRQKPPTETRTKLTEIIQNRSKLKH